MWVKVQLFNCRSKEKELHLGKKKGFVMEQFSSGCLFCCLVTHSFPWSHACNKTNRQLSSHIDNFCFPYSCFGAISSLNGEPEKGVAVEVRA